MKLPKELRKRYDADFSSRQYARIVIRLNMQERIILKERLAEEGWENVAGYIRSKVFSKNTKAEYTKILKSGDSKKAGRALSSLMEELASQIGYINCRFDYMLTQIEKESDLEGNIKARKMFAMTREYQRTVLERTENITYDCETILRFLNIKYEKTQRENIRFAPDSVIDKARKDWNDTRSPAALEAVRRDFEKFHENMRAMGLE